MADAEKTLDATPQRRQQARADGHVARSQELTSSAVMVGGVLALALSGAALCQFLIELLSGALSGKSWLAALGTQTNRESFYVEQWHALLPAVGKVVLPLLVLAMLWSIGANLLQTGFLFLPGKLMPELSRVNPVSGLARLFSGTGLLRLVFALTKLGVIAGVAYYMLSHSRDELLGLATLDLGRLSTAAWEICLTSLVKLSLALLALSGLDYAYQRWRHEQDLKMTPQEMREEMRNLQGDPQVVARRRTLAGQLSVNRYTVTVPKADVVIEHADQTAVALRYDAATMDAPLVVAKGTKAAATEIRRLALENGVVVVENKALAEAIHRRADLQAAVPLDLFASTAEALAQAYQLTHKAA